VNEEPSSGSLLSVFQVLLTVGVRAELLKLLGTLHGVGSQLGDESILGEGTETASRSIGCFQDSHFEPLAGETAGCGEAADPGSDDEGSGSSPIHG